jgi:hypothetical protein
MQIDEQFADINGRLKGRPHFSSGPPSADELAALEAEEEQKT